ncbi:hypothetical protein FS837_006243 [Tulasnella sp. UAMH 9824]|nr:hypothetical protein FS837_006243 [Tulasnella sp. UAMH 9824]
MCFSTRHQRPQIRVDGAQRVFIKTGSDLLGGAETQKYLYEQSVRDPSAAAPRLPVVYDSFEIGRVGFRSAQEYIVMEYIEAPTVEYWLEKKPDMAESLYDNVAEAVRWILNCPLPPEPRFGPVGRGPAQHGVFADHVAPLEFDSVDAVQRYFTKLSPMALDKLKLLEKQLNRLPTSLPSPPIQQSSYQWHLDSDFLNDEGIVAATNQMLERVMSMRASGLTLREQGKGILGVVEVLNTALKDEPDNSIIEKWIDDITEAAKRLCPGENGSSAIDVDESPKSAGPASKKVNSNSSNGDNGQKKPKLKKAAPKPKQSALNTMLPPKMAVVPMPVTKAATGPVSNDGVNGPENHSDPAYNPKTDLTYDDPRFLDLAEPEVDRSKGGAIPDEDMLAATIHCRALEGSDAGKEFARCLGSFKCNGIWVWPRRKDRILKHLSTCQYIPATLRKSSSKKQGDKAPVAMLEKRKAEDDQIEKEVERSASKKRRGKVAEKETSQPSLVLDLARNTGRKEMKETLDNDVVMLICVAGLPP